MLTRATSRCEWEPCGQEAQARIIGRDIEPPLGWVHVLFETDAEDDGPFRQFCSKACALAYITAWEPNPWKPELEEDEVTPV